ncbi:MAG: ATP-grasp domain-containing protein [Blastocatellia bacterium]|nr:ATP-grasp domain-containing protein [Blastocatellia bacterium]
MARRIWFSQWFATAYHYINFIRNNPDGRRFEIFVTHTNPYSATLQAADKATLEPKTGEAGFLEFSLNFCRRNKIDIFVPGGWLRSISRNVEEFHKIGTRVLVCSDSELMNLLSDKDATYKAFKEKSLMPVPDYYIATNLDQFVTAYHKLREKGHTVCFKPKVSVGGFGFRVISEKANSLDLLYGAVNEQVCFKQVCQTLSSKSSFPALVVSEYLSGFEYSIDCLGWNGELLAAVPRKKVGLARKLENKKELIEIAHKVVKEFPLPYIFNVQVKYQKEGSRKAPKLLEVNPRMSGGLHVSCLSGINFPYLAVKLLSGEEIEVPTPRLNITVSSLETCVEIGQIEGRNFRYGSIYEHDKTTNV